MNEIDLKIANILQSNARTSNAEIARQVGLVPSAVLERVRKLEERGIIRGYKAQIDARSVGLGLLAFVMVRTDDLCGESEAAVELARIPEVLELHHVAGEDCFLVKVRAADTETLGQLLRDRIGAIKSVRSTRTTIVLRTAKETTELPVGSQVELEGDDE